MHVLTMSKSPSVGGYLLSLAKTSGTSPHTIPFLPCRLFALILEGGYDITTSEAVEEQDSTGPRATTGIRLKFHQMQFISFSDQVPAGLEDN